MCGSDVRAGFADRVGRFECTHKISGDVSLALQRRAWRAHLLTNIEPYSHYIYNRKAGIFK